MAPQAYSTRKLLSVPLRRRPHQPQARRDGRAEAGEGEGAEGEDAAGEDADEAEGAPQPRSGVWRLLGVWGQKL